MIILNFFHPKWFQSYCKFAYSSLGIHSWHIYLSHHGHYLIKILKYYLRHAEINNCGSVTGKIFKKADELRGYSWDYFKIFNTKTVYTIFMFILWHLLKYEYFIVIAINEQGLHNSAKKLLYILYVQCFLDRICLILCLKNHCRKWLLLVGGEIILLPAEN